MANAKQSAAWKREAKKKEAKKQGIALVVSTKNPAKKAVKRVVKEKDPVKEFHRVYKDFTPVGTVYFEPFMGPVKITKIEKWSKTSVMLNVTGVLVDAHTGEINVMTKRFEKSSSPKAFDVKKFLKDINVLYKKTYLS